MKKFIIFFCTMLVLTSCGAIRRADYLNTHNVSPEIKEAFNEYRVVPGMTKEIVLMCYDSPSSKGYEEKEKVKYEYWVYKYWKFPYYKVTFTNDIVVSIIDLDAQ